MPFAPGACTFAGSVSTALPVISRFGRAGFRSAWGLQRILVNDPSRTRKRMGACANSDPAGKHPRAWAWGSDSPIAKIRSYPLREFPHGRVGKKPGYRAAGNAEFLEAFRRLRFYDCESGTVRNSAIGWRLGGTDFQTVRTRRNAPTRRRCSQTLTTTQFASWVGPQNSRPKHGVRDDSPHSRQL